MKKIMFFCAVLTLVFGLFATAHANVTSYAVSWDNIYNGFFTFTSSPIGAITPSDTTEASASINGVGSVSQIGPVSTAPPIGPVQVALGTPTPSSFGNMTQLGIRPTNYSVGQAEIVSNQNFPTNTVGIQAVNKAESNVVAPPTTTAGAEGHNFSTTAVTFNVTLPVGTVITFKANAAPYMDVNVSTSGGSIVGLPTTVAQAALSAVLTISLGNQEVFRWAPDGSAGGITGGSEDLDPFTLNNTISQKTGAGDTPYDPTTLGGAIVGAFNPTPVVPVANLFQAHTNSLAAGEYTVTLQMTESTAVTAATVPEPGTLLLVGAGLLSLVAISRRKRT